MTWFMAIPEEGTYEEMKHKLLALPWGWDVEPVASTLAEVWPHLFCTPDWKPWQTPLAWEKHARTFDEMRQYAMLAGKAIVFSDGMLYDAEQHAIRAGIVSEQLAKDRMDICTHIAAEALLKYGADLL